MNSSTLIDLLQKHNIFLTGGAGVGKSYLTNSIINQMQYLGKNVIPLGSTGISAVNIGGYTLHSFFVFGISSSLQELKRYDSKNKKRVGELKKVLQNCDLLIIDEISMVSANLMDMIYYRLDSLGFSGKLMVVGDFYQLPPIIKKEENNSLIKSDVYAFESSSWGRFDFKAIVLEDVKRTTDKDFINVLQKIRVGQCDNEVKSYLNSLRENSFKVDIEPTYLFGINSKAEDMNKIKLSSLNTNEAIYFWDVKEYEPIDDRRFSSWSKALPVIEQLHIKEEAPVIFTINKWGKFVNGQRGVVKELGDDYVVVRSDGKDITVYTHDFEMLSLDAETLESRVVATISQFPFKLAYAITIHKSQGMSIGSLVCNLDNLFTPGQLYVALSRAISPKFLKLEYNRSDFNSYLDRIIVSNEIVDKFYKGLKVEN